MCKQISDTPLKINFLGVISRRLLMLVKPPLAISVRLATEFDVLRDIIFVLYSNENRTFRLITTPRPRPTMTGQ